MVDTSAAELGKAYFAYAERFRVEPHASFKHAFFSPQRRLHPETDAESALLSISTAGGDDRATTVGDPLLLESEYHDVDVETVSNVFGAEFARRVFLLKPGSWAGPVKSGYGVHLVELTDLKPATLLPFEEVRTFFFS